MKGTWHFERRATNLMKETDAARQVGYVLVSHLVDFEANVRKLCPLCRCTIKFPFSPKSEWRWETEENGCWTSHLKYAFSQTRLNPKFLPKNICIFCYAVHFGRNWGKGSQIKALVNKESRIQSSNQMLPVQRVNVVFDNTLSGVCVDNCKNAIRDK